MKDKLESLVKVKKENTQLKLEIDRLQTGVREQIENLRLELQKADEEIATLKVDR